MTGFTCNAGLTRMVRRHGIFEPSLELERSRLNSKCVRARIVGKCCDKRLLPARSLYWAAPAAGGRRSRAALPASSAQQGTMCFSRSNKRTGFRDSSIACDGAESLYLKGETSVHAEEAGSRTHKFLTSSQGL